jgi:hypothetical protein
VADGAGKHGEVAGRERCLEAKPMLEIPATENIAKKKSDDDDDSRILTNITASSI